MSRIARIHIYLGTFELPKRDLGDQEVAHDVIDLQIGDNESVMQMDLVEQPVYRRRMQTTEEAAVSAGNRALFGGRSEVVAREVTDHLKSMVGYRYRVVTLEHTDALDHSSEEVHDAQIVDEN